MNIHKVNITILTPTHIGCDKKLTSAGEYIATNNNIQIIDQNSVNDIFKQDKELRNLFLSSILEKGVNVNVWEFFKSHNVEDNLKFAQVSKLNAKEFNPNSNNILELTIETNGKKYIPGSTLKGVFRTIFFAYLIKKDFGVQSEIERIIDDNQSLHRIKDEVLILEKKQLDSTFGKLLFEDSSEIENQFIEMEIAKRVHLFGIDIEGLDLIRQCISKDTTLSFGLKIKDKKENILEYFWSPDLKSVFKIINEIVKDYIIFEVELLKNSKSETAKKITENLNSILKQIEESENYQAFIRLGKGKTLFFQVILPFISEKSRTKILNLIVKDDDKANFPATRIINDFDEMFGWVKLSVEGLVKKELVIVENFIEDVQLGMTIMVNYIAPKIVSFKLNGIMYNNVQLVNPLKRVFEKNEVIKVIITQTNKEGIIKIVKINF